MSLSVSKSAVLSLLLFFPIAALSDLTGSWTVTRMIKTTELQTNARGARPSKSIGIVQTIYNFNADGTITTAGGNQGTWKEKKGQFSLSFDKKLQADNLTQSLSDQGFQVNSVKILSDTSKGTVYPNGIMGTSTGIFTIDINTNQGPYKAKMTVTFSYAGLTPTPTALNAMPTTSGIAENAALSPIDETGIVDVLMARLSAAK